MALMLLFLIGGCTVNEEKNPLQLARINQEDVIKIVISRSEKNIDLTNQDALAYIMEQMKASSPALDAGKTRMGTPLRADYVLEVFTAPGADPVVYHYNSEKQWLYLVSGSKRTHPYKCEPILNHFTYLFGINRYTAIIKEKEGLPVSFDATGWLSRNMFYGLKGNQFLLWDTDKGATELLLTDAWNILLSPDLSKLAYTNKKGLNIFDLHSLTSFTAVKAGKTITDNQAALFCWSPDSNKLIYGFEKVWHTDFFIFDSETKKSQPFTFKNETNFLSTPVAWLPNGKILFIVSSSSSKSGCKDYKHAGYRSDLMETDLEGNFRPITRMKDHSYLSFAGLTKEGRTALVMVRKGGAPEYKLALTDLTKGSLEYLPWSNIVITAGISPDGRFLAVGTPLEEYRTGYRLELFDRYTGETIFTYENPDYSVPKKIVWSQDGSKFFFLEKCQQNSSNNKLRVVKILPL